MRPAARAPGEVALLAAVWVVLAGLVLAAGGCRSPLAATPEKVWDPSAVGRGVHAWPLYEVAYEGDLRRTDVLWPLASLSADAAGKVHHADVLWPVGHYENTGETRGGGIRPLVDVRRARVGDGEEATLTDVDLAWPFLHWRTGPEQWAFELRPVVWLGENPRDRWRIVFPFWWDLLDHGGKGRETRLVHLWPVYGERQRGTEHTRYIVFPLLRTSTDPDPERQLHEWDVLWPLFHAGRSREAREIWAVPLYYQRLAADARSRVIFPFWWDFQDAQGSFWMFFPFLGRQQRKDGFQRDFFLFPLLVRSREPRGGMREWDVLPPLLHLEHDRDSWGQAESWAARVFPVLWLRREPTRSLTAVWPLFGVSHATARRTTWSTLWPFFRLEKGVVPATGKTPEESYWQWDGPWPLVWMRRGEQRDTMGVFPLFDSVREEKGTPRERSSWSVLSLLARCESTAGGEEAPGGEAGAPGTRSGPPGAPDEKARASGSPPGRTTRFRVLWRWIEWTRSPQRSVFALNPLVHIETNPAGDRSWSALLGMFGATRTAERSERWAFWFLRF